MTEHPRTFEEAFPPTPPRDVEDEGGNVVDNEMLELNEVEDEALVQNDVNINIDIPVIMIQTIRDNIIVLDIRRSPSP